MLLIYAGLMALASWQFNRVPTGFIPAQDQGYLIVSIQLPSGASLSETDKVVQDATRKLLAIDGVANTVGFTGFSGATRANASNAAAIFPTLDSFEKREQNGILFADLLQKVILIVPMYLLSAISGVALAGMDNNILTQIGFVVLVGLASKNAILIVEFARDLERQGRDRWQAAVEAARLRLRPILMTSFAFILGVVPLVLAQGAGAEMRRALGVAVFSGMLGVTFFGLIFTPVFYVLCRKLSFIRPKERVTNTLNEGAGA